MSPAVEPAAWVLQTIADQLQKERGGTRDRPNVQFYASGLGDVLELRDEGKPSGCARKAYLGFFPQIAPPLPKTTESLLNLEVGNAFHERVEKLLWNAGVLVRSEYALKRGNISGRLDWLVQIPAHGLCVLDGKSMADYAFDKADAPKREHVAQVNYYAGEMGVQLCGLVYYKKSNGDMKVFVFPYDPALYAETQTAAGALALRVTLDRTSGTNTNMPPIPEGIRKDKFPCSWWNERTGSGGSCDFYSFCHGDLPPHLKAREPAAVDLVLPAKTKLQGGT